MSAFYHEPRTRKPDPSVIRDYKKENEDAPCELLNSDAAWPECRCRGCYDQANIRWQNQELFEGKDE